KTFLALGLSLRLAEEGYRVGYCKPLGKTPVKKGRDVFDADAVFIKEALSLPEHLQAISPFVLTFESQNLLLEGKLKGLKGRVIEAIRSQEDRDVVIVGGPGDLFEGASLEIDPLSLMEEMEAKAVAVEAWMGDVSVDSLLGMKRLLGEGFAGGIINKVPKSAVAHVQKRVRPFLEARGVRVLGVFAKDTLLEAISARELNEILNGKILCCESGLDEYVEHFLIGAMDVDSALNYFRRTPNKAVITGAHRTDIQLAALETSTRCLILTGGLHVNAMVVGKAQALGIPIISVASDTFTTIDTIESAIGKTRIREKGKIERIRELMKKEFDLEGFLKAARVR
ncbi:MAG: DRTGG domain-containing protein, partial [Thermodesulfovibrionales bacterium]